MRKKKGNELNGLAHYFNCNMEGLSFPLLTLVDYKGFRVIATCQLPIGRDTLIYGSLKAIVCFSIQLLLCHKKKGSFDGLNVKDEEFKVNEMMKSLGRQLNIKGHLCGLKKKIVVYSPADIQVHRGKDGRVYILSFSR